MSSSKRVSEYQRLGEPEKFAYRRGDTCLVGVDEVGRGPLAGNVVAAAVSLPETLPECLSELNDSKKLTEKKRLYLARLIIRHAVSYGVNSVSPTEIDQLNIFQATFVAMRGAVQKTVQRLHRSPDLVFVDGKFVIPNLEFEQMAIIKGDRLSLNIAAASILAKVVRDRQMVVASKDFPKYGFEQHKGYGTRAHRQALKDFGPTPLHRRSFKWRAPE